MIFGENVPLWKPDVLNMLACFQEIFRLINDTIEQKGVVFYTKYP